MNDIQVIQKCKHGWYIPSWAEDKSKSFYCSGCYVPEVGINSDPYETKKLEQEWSIKVPLNLR